LPLLSPSLHNTDTAGRSQGVISGRAGAALRGDGRAAAGVPPWLGSGLQVIVSPCSTQQEAVARTTHRGRAGFVLGGSMRLAPDSGAFGPWLDGGRGLLWSAPNRLDWRHTSGGWPSMGGVLGPRSSSSALGGAAGLGSKNEQQPWPFWSSHWHLALGFCRWRCPPFFAGRSVQPIDPFSQSGRPHAGQCSTNAPINPSINPTKQPTNPQHTPVNQTTGPPPPPVAQPQPVPVWPPPPPQPWHQQHPPPAATRPSPTLRPS
jgi:hypothetical protein